MSINPDASGESPTEPASDPQKSSSQNLGQAKTQAREDLDAVTRRAQEEMRALGEHAKEAVGDMGDQAKSFAADQKALAANQIRGVADAISKVADELRGSEHQSVARYAHDLSRSLSGIGKSIEERDVDDLMGMAESFGRSQPVAFLGAAALAGFVASRFALASTHRRQTKSSVSQSSSVSAHTGTERAGGGQ